MRRIRPANICRASAASRIFAGPNRSQACGWIWASTRAMRCRRFTIRCWESSLPGANRARRRPHFCIGRSASLEIAGVATNRALLMSILADEQFQRAEIATDFLSVRRSHLKFGEPAPAATDFVLAALWCATADTAADSLWSDTTGWRLASIAVTRWRFGDTTVVAREDGIR